MKPVTLWYRKNDKGEYEFNHLEDDHCITSNPTPKTTIHEKVWKGKWKSTHAYLNDDNVVITGDEK
jgi:hypothetical protein